MTLDRIVFISKNGKCSKYIKTIQSICKKKLLILIQINPKQNEKQKLQYFFFIYNL